MHNYMSIYDPDDVTDFENMCAVGYQLLSTSTFSNHLQSCLDTNA